MEGRGLLTAAIKCVEFGDRNKFLGIFSRCTVHCYSSPCSVDCFPTIRMHFHQRSGVKQLMQKQKLLKATLSNHGIHPWGIRLFQVQL